MSKLARVLTLVAMLAAIQLAGMTAIAHAEGGSAVTHDGGRPPTQRQVGEVWDHRQAAADARTITGNQRPPLERQVGESYRHRLSNVRPAERSRRPGWPVASLGVLAAAVVGSAGLVVLAARRAGRRTRVGHAA